ncbi:uncharacterized protein FRV6_10095 [Fusarium oxysporum]|uniref:C2H2-type domain-containing protein n=1 Tax=Fusarium oxysporum TaxID=5507 RepID=A0A2H3TB31_FUSOX|nr:uncharacterized protein FRV6_10095 [Fusarium oxysporum]
MQGESSVSNSSDGDHRRRAVTAGPHLAFNGTEPQRLHDVNRDLWQQSFQSAMASAFGHLPTLSLYFCLCDYCLSGSDSGSLPHPLQTQTFSNQDTLSQCGFASPTEPTTTDAGLQTSPNQDITSAQVHEPRRCGSRPFSCPDCHIYTTNRKYNLNRHRETRHGKIQNSN